MTAARVELRRLLLALLMLSEDAGRVGGDGVALKRVGRHERRKMPGVEGGYIVQRDLDEDRRRGCGSVSDSMVI